ncbi:uncharacterized protein LOC143236084 [Tachypleus tridentatus]|uniref:uncharacterized protein LOC143236084 n=1 Tax=Tachypleus tridentatus TaxID=6853 RepID=UPI003FD403A1
MLVIWGFLPFLSRLSQPSPTSVLVMEWVVMKALPSPSLCSKVPSLFWEWGLLFLISQRIQVSDHNMIFLVNFVPVVMNLVIDCLSCLNQLLFGVAPSSSGISVDLDDEVARGGIRQFFSDKPCNRSFYKGVTVRTIRGADGRTEEQKTVHDGKGNEETTVCRTIGDQTYCVTTCTDSSGAKKRKETMINLDDKAVPEFEKKWSEKSQEFVQEDVRKDNDSYNSIFKNFLVSSHVNFNN